MGSVLELALALQHGKLPRLLGVALKMFQQHALIRDQIARSNGGDRSAETTAMLPSVVVSFLEQIADHEPEYGLDCSHSNHHIGAARWSDWQGELLPLALAASSGFAYVICGHNNTIFKLFKVGTGMCGTTLGRYTLRARKCMACSMVAVMKHCQVVLGVFSWGHFPGNRLVVFSNSAPNSVVCISMNDLSILRTIQLTGEKPRPSGISPHEVARLVYECQNQMRHHPNHLHRTPIILAQRLLQRLQKANPNLPHR